MEGDIVQMGAYIGAGLACTGMGGAAKKNMERNRHSRARSDETRPKNRLYALAGCRAAHRVAGAQRGSAVT